MKKALIFDCDNTLWKGVVGEDSIIPDETMESNIMFLANRGVIIGICSKNNEEDIMPILKERLLDRYISVKRINWKDKASNLKEIAQELNIGLDAIVFVDDSPFEINLVCKKLPEVMAIHPNNLMTTVINSFDLTGDFTKTQQYKDNYKRAKAQEQFTDINDYLASLDMVLTIKVNEEAHIPRIAELTQKTNQFNLTALRYTEETIKDFMKYGHVYTLSVKDTYGDNGLVGVCIVMGGVIDTFLLSCRILGREIEYAFMDKVFEDYREMQSQDIDMWGIYNPTSKNEQVADFYSKLGFNLAENKNVFIINIKDYKPQAKNHFRYE